MSLVEFGYRRDFLKTNIAPLLDHLRWIAALCVCLAHLRNLLFPDASQVSHPGHLVKLFYFFTLFGTQAVIVFFVISGLLIGGKVIEGLIDSNFQTKRYTIDRLARLYVVLIPALFLSLALSKVGLGRCSVGVVDLLGNFAFLQNVAVAPVCNNHPLWSLSNEAAYYLLFPLAIFSFVGKHRKICGALTIVLLVTLTIVIRPDRQDILLAAPIWCFGLIPLFLRIKLPIYVVFPIFFAALFASRMHYFPNFYLDDETLGLLLALTLCCDINIKFVSGAWAAGFSYSLYLVHMPLATAAAVILGVGNPHNPKAYVIYTSVLFGILFVAWLFGRFFEANTKAVRNAVLTLISKPTIPAHASPVNADN